jgi:hypothetical protein
MDHFDISNTVESVGKFRVGGVATPDVAFFSGF